VLCVYREPFIKKDKLNSIEKNTLGVTNRVSSTIHFDCLLWVC